METADNFADPIPQCIINFNFSINIHCSSKLVIVYWTANRIVLSCREQTLRLRTQTIFISVRLATHKAGQTMATSRSLFYTYHRSQIVDFTLTQDQRKKRVIDSFLPYDYTFNDSKLMSWCHKVRHRHRRSSDKFKVYVVVEMEPPLGLKVYTCL